MSKIDQSIEFIRQFTASKDQSNTPAMRQAVEIYARACSEVNKDLQHCAKLLNSGLRQDAQNYANSMHPPLSSRANQLLLAPVTTGRLLELCELYQYAKPEPVDRKTLAQLCNPNADADKLQELIRRWRQTARSGSSFEKIRILRAILAAAPVDSQIWKNNLRAVEKQFLDELYTEADAALQDKDAARLCDLYQAMSSPELLTEPDPQQLEKFQKPVKIYQQKLLGKELKSKLEELFRQYNLQNHSATAQLMREYDVLCTHPLYQPDPADEPTVSEIRRYLEECKKQHQLQQEFAQRSQELYAAIEKRAPFPEIENIYSILRRTGMPVDETLDLRIKLLRQDYENERNRTHIRKCFYGALAAILLGGIAVALFLLLQTFRSNRSYSEDMEKLISTGNYQAVQELYDKISRENPMVLKFGKINGLYLESKRLQEVRDGRVKNLRELASACYLELSRPAPQISKLQYLVKQINTIGCDDLSSDLAMDLQKIKFELRNLESARQLQEEKEFISACQKLNTQLTQIIQALSLPDTKPHELNLQIKKIDQSAQIIFSAPGNINSKLFQASQRMYKNLWQEASDKYAETVKIQKLQAVLAAPPSAESYLETLSRLPVEAPLLATGIWSKAIADLPQSRMLIKAAALPSTFQHTGELSLALNQQAIDMPDNPAIADQTLMLPSEYAINQVKTFIARMRADYSALYNCRELVLLSSQNQRCRFYTTDEPLIEKSRTSRIPKAIGIKVMLMPGSEGKFVVLRVIKNGLRTIIYPGRIENLTLPVYFVDAENTTLTNMAIPTAEHSTFLQSMLLKLAAVNRCDELEKVVTDLLKKLKQADSMNIFVRAHLTGELLKLLPAAAPLYANMTAATVRQLESAVGKQLAPWYEPDAEIKYKTQYEALKGFFKQLDVDLMQKRCRFIRQLYTLSLERGLVPGGIVSHADKKSILMHSFQWLKNPSEMWFYQPGDAQKTGSWIVLDGSRRPEEIFALAKDLPINRGTIFFIPMDGRNTAELAAETVKSARKLGINEIPWPHNWPTNCR